MPPAMQAHTNPTLNQWIRLRDQSAGIEVGTVGLAVTTGLKRSVFSRALRRSINERISHFSPRLRFHNHTACSLSNSIRQAKCGPVMCVEITNGNQIFHVIYALGALLRQATRYEQRLSRWHGVRRATRVDRRVMQGWQTLGLAEFARASVQPWV